MAVNDLMGSGIASGNSVKEVARNLIVEQSSDASEKQEDKKPRQQKRQEARSARKDERIGDPFPNRQYEGFLRDNPPEDDDVEVDDDDATDEEGRQQEPQQRKPSSEEEDDDNSASEEGDDEAEEDDDAAQEGADDQEGEEGFEELTDDTLISVTVDGEEKEVSLGDLKRRYSGEGAIERRLQEATELRNSLEKQRREHQQAVDHDRQTITQALVLFQNKLLAPRVPEPDPNLRYTDAQKFSEQVQAWTQDQHRIQQEQQGISQAIQQQEQYRQAVHAQKKAEESKILRDKLPVFKDPIEGPKLRQSILNAATKHYGFKQEELAEADDHRYFLVLADAAAYRELMDKQQKNVKEGDNDKNADKLKPGQRRIRTMKPGNKEVSRVRTSRREEDKVKKRAWETGRVEDVAKTIIAKPRRRRDV